MPVKRRKAKRYDPAREYEIWSGVFDGGHDFFDELPELGLPSCGIGTVPAELASEPWRRLGRRWLAEQDDQQPLRPFWAVEQFGKPWEVNDAN